MFKIVPLFIGFLLVSCGPTSQVKTELSLAFDGKVIDFTYTPTKPQIGDSVELTISSRDKQTLPPSLNGLGIPLRTWDQGQKALYRILVKKPGPFQPTGFPEALWKVPETGDMNWIDISQDKLFPKKTSMNSLAIAVGALLIAVLIGLWFYFKGRPGKMDPRIILMKNLETWDGDISPEALKPLYRQMRDFDLLKNSEAKARMKRILYSMGTPEFGEVQHDVREALALLKGSGRV